MQVAAIRQSAATVLRTVPLYRAVEVAQDPDLTYLKGSFEGWMWRAKRDIQIRIQDIEWLCGCYERSLHLGVSKSVGAMEVVGGSAQG